MITANELKKKQIEIQNRIEIFAKENGLSNDIIEPIYDGVYNIDTYLSKSPRIMWILKEPVDEVENGKPSGGGWMIFDPMIKDHVKSSKNPTWRRMIYTSYGIINQKAWNEMDWIRDDLSMVDILKQIAYINISKMPGNIKSEDNKIKKCYDLWHSILYEQIRVYDPQIIIFGNTFKFFKKDLLDSEVKPIKQVGGYLDVYEGNGALLFDAYHPSVWKNDCIKIIIEIALKRH
jgi:hypothetical protein